MKIKHCFLFYSLALFAAGFVSKANAQMVLGGPGVGLNYRQETVIPFSHTVDLGRYYKYVFAGAEAQADADGVPGSFSYDGFMWDKPKKNNHGHGNNVDGVDASNPGKSKEGEDSDPSVDDEKKGGNGDGGGSGSSETSQSVEKVNGWWSLLTRVNLHEINGLDYASPALHTSSDVIRVYFDVPIVLREETIILRWAGEGNSHDPDGHLHILGDAIKEPPIPWGSLNLGQTMYTEGSQPTFSWEVTRE